MSRFRRFFLIGFSFIICWLSGCDKLDSGLEKKCFIPYVDFVALNVNPNTLEVVVQDIKAYNGVISKHKWDFGDGTIILSSTPPVHKYPPLNSSSPTKTYRIRYTVGNDCGESFWSKEIKVGPCLANTRFSAIFLNDSTVQFTNQTTSSTTVSYLWDFGDGTSSVTSATTFAKLFRNSGTYTVSLKATNSCGENSWTQSINISIKPTVQTTAPTNIVFNGFTSGGNVIGSGGLAITERGVCWSISPQPTITNTRSLNGTGTGSFTSIVSGLIPNTLYYVRAYATSTAGTGYGAEYSFRTPATLATVSSSIPSGIGTSFVTLGGSITNDGGAAVTSRGVCWSTLPNPTTSNSYVLNGSGLGAFSNSIGGLNPNTLYYARAFAINSVGTSYGNQVSFTTLASLPVVSTTSVSSVTVNNAVSGGNVSSDGGFPVTARGICWNTTGTPTIANSRTFDGSGTGSFISTATGLLPNTTYYLRAYATTQGGTGYGAQIVFTTPSGEASVNTSTVSSITSSTAISGGSILSDGGAPITFRGVCWSTLTNPTTSNSRTIDGSGVGSFSSNVTGLLPNTTYYIRAYATNSTGTYYGPQLSFTTNGGYSVGGIGPAGGRVFYDKGFYSNGWRYIEAASVNQSISATWGCSGVSITGATSTGIGSGINNTISIVNACLTSGIAARICDQLVLNGYSDWYLPSLSEAQLMYSNLAARGLGGFNVAYYWTSTQATSTTAYLQYFGSNTSPTTSKSSSYYVRAIRYF